MNFVLICILTAFRFHYVTTVSWNPVAIKDRVKRSHYGIPIKPEKWPSFVLIETTSTPDPYTVVRQYCSGSLISSTSILTAAHCIKRNVSVTITVKLGFDQRNRFTVRSKAKSFTFVDPLKIHDFAIVTLESPVIFNSFVKPIEIATQEIEIGAECVSVGGGYNHYGEHTRYHPTQVILTVLNSWQCCQLQKSHQICTGNWRNQVDEGDSGGPLYCWDNGKWKLYGLAIHYFKNKCNSNIISVFAKVNHYI